MKSNTPDDASFSAPTALELAKLKPIVECLITIESNQRAIMWGQATMLYFLSEKQFSVDQWQSKLAAKGSSAMDDVTSQVGKSLNALAAMLESATGSQKN